MLQYIAQLIVVAISVLIAARIVPGIRVKSFGSAVFFAFVLGLLNVILKPVLLILGLPFLILTLGLFYFAINIFLFWLADKIVDGVEVNGFGAYVLGSLITSLVSWGIMALFHLNSTHAYGHVYHL